MNRKMVSSLLILFMTILLVSCSSRDITTSEASAGSTTTGSSPSETTISTLSTIDYLHLLEEIEALKKAVRELTYSKSSYEARIENLEQNLADATKGSSLMSNYVVIDLLKMIYENKSVVDIFPGFLKDIRVEIGDENVFLVFTIDRMEINPKWQNPGSGEVFLLNKEEKYEEYRGTQDTIFEFQGYETYQEKLADILTRYGNSIYNFYRIGDLIVFVDVGPGP